MHAVTTRADRLMQELDFRTDQALSLAQDVVVDVNIGTHTHQVTSAVV